MIRRGVDWVWRPVVLVLRRVWSVWALFNLLGVGDLGLVASVSILLWALVVIVGVFGHPFQWLGGAASIAVAFDLLRYVLSVTYQ